MGNECWSAVAKWSYFSHYIYCGVPFKEEEEEEAKQKRRYRSASSRRTLSFKLDRAQKVCLLFWLGSHVTRWWFSAPTVFSAAIGCWPYLYTPAHSFFPLFREEEEERLQTPPPCRRHCSRVKLERLGLVVLTLHLAVFVFLMDFPDLIGII